MSRIRGKDTKPEMAVRRLVHGMGFRYRLHRRDLPGSPDLVLPRHRKVILVHGCFWHRHPECTKASTPKTRAEFWESKFDTNVARDIRVVKELELLGWRVVTIWECETRSDDRVRELLNRYVPI